MPTPSGWISGAASKTRQAMPAWCSASASVRPPMPPPTIRTSESDRIPAIDVARPLQWGEAGADGGQELVGEALGRPAVAAVR